MIQIQSWLVIGIIIVLSYILIDHTVYVVKYKRLKMASESYVPRRTIFIYNEKTKAQVQPLYEIAVKAHAQHGIDTLITFTSIDGYKKHCYVNGNEIWFIDINSSFEYLTPDLIHAYNNRVFVGKEMSDGSIRACIEKLGLIDYAFTFGFCGEGGKDDDLEESK